MTHTNRKTKNTSSSWKLAILVGAVCLVLGAGTGAGIVAANQPDSIDTEPIRTVEQVEVEKEVPITPVECVEAIATGHELLGELHLRAGFAALGGDHDDNVDEIERKWDEQSQKCLDKRP